MNEDNVSFIATTINDCGTACEIAEIAARLQKLIKYLKLGKVGHTGMDRKHWLLQSAYENLLDATLAWAGVPTGFTNDEYDTAIASLDTSDDLPIVKTP